MLRVEAPEIGDSKIIIVGPSRRKPQTENCTLEPAPVKTKREGLLPPSRQEFY
jgi:hypothetical protein